MKKHLIGWIVSIVATLALVFVLTACTGTNVPASQNDKGIDYTYTQFTPGLTMQGYAIVSSTQELDALNTRCQGMLLGTEYDAYCTSMNHLPLALSDHLISDKMREFDETFFETKELLLVSDVTSHVESRTLNNVQLVRDKLVVSLERPAYDESALFLDAVTYYLFLIELDKEIGKPTVVVKTYDTNGETTNPEGWSRELITRDGYMIDKINAVLAQEQQSAPADLEALNALLEENDIYYNWMYSDLLFGVLWYKEANRVMLYGKNSNNIYYPQEFSATWQEGENTVNLLSCTDAGKGPYAQYGETVTLLGGNRVSIARQREKMLLQQLGEATETEDVRRALGLSADDVIYVNKQEVQNSKTYSIDTTYAYKVVASIVTSRNETEQRDNCYFIGVIVDDKATDNEIAAANHAAAQYLDDILASMALGEASSDHVAILLESGLTLDVVGCEWAPIAGFVGFVGTTDETAPVTITGARIRMDTESDKSAERNATNEEFCALLFGSDAFCNIKNITFENAVVIETIE